MSNISVGQLQEIIALGGHVSERVMEFDGVSQGRVGTETLFSVTGLIRGYIIALVDTTLVGAATIEAGVSGATAGLIAQVANATSLVAKEIWHDATPDAFIELGSVGVDRFISNHVIQTIGSATVTAGKIRYILIWRPVTTNAAVEVVETSPSPSLSVSPSASASRSASLSVSPSASVSPSSSASSSRSPSASASLSVSPSSSASSSVSPSASSSRSNSPSPSPSA